MRSYRIAAIVFLLFGVVVSVLFTAQPVEATGTPALGRLQGYESQNLTWLQQNYPSLYSQIEALPWVSDGLSSLERDFIDELLYVGVEDITSLEAALGLVWVQDAVTLVEYRIVFWLASVGVNDALVMRALISMPFFESPDATDALALQSIWLLAYTGSLAPLKGHAAFLDGISEDETTLVTAAGTLYRYPEEASRMLDTGYASIETATSATDVNLSIVRTGSQYQSWTAGALADAVEFLEQTMLLDLPVDHVVLVFSDKALSADAVGFNYRFAISYSPAHEQSRDTFEGKDLQLGLTHEAAHYYWIGNAHWIDEGIANTLEHIYGSGIGLNPDDLYEPRDCDIPHLQRLTELDPSRDDPQFYCHYHLGELLFRELRGNMSESEFNNKLAELYVQTLWEQADGLIPGITVVRQVFNDQADIVDRHWAGAPTTGSVVGDRYDANSDGFIDLGEALGAVADYFADTLDLLGALEIVALYFAGLSA